MLRFRKIIWLFAIVGLVFPLSGYAGQRAKAVRVESRERVRDPKTGRFATEQQLRARSQLRDPKTGRFATKKQLQARSQVRDPKTGRFATERQLRARSQARDERGRFAKATLSENPSETILEQIAAQQPTHTEAAPMPAATEHTIAPSTAILEGKGALRAGIRGRLGELTGWLSRTFGMSEGVRAARTLARNSTRGGDFMTAANVLKDAPEPQGLRERLALRGAKRDLVRQLTNEARIQSVTTGAVPEDVQAALGLMREDPAFRRQIERAEYKSFKNVLGVSMLEAKNGAFEESLGRLAYAAELPGAKEKDLNRAARGVAKAARTFSRGFEKEGNFEGAAFAAQVEAVATRMAGKTPNAGRVERLMRKAAKAQDRGGIQGLADRLMGRSGGVPEQAPSPATEQQPTSSPAGAEPTLADMAGFAPLGDARERAEEQAAAQTGNPYTSRVPSQMVGGPGAGMQH